MDVHFVVFLSFFFLVDLVNAISSGLFSISSLLVSKL